MFTKFYLTVKENGSIRSTKNQPWVHADEVCIALQIEIPDAMFQRPSLCAEITIPEDAAMKSPINAEVADNVAEAVRAATGLEFSITVRKEEEGDND